LQRPICGASIFRMRKMDRGTVSQRHLFHNDLWKTDAGHGHPALGASFGCFTLLLTLRRPPSGRLEGWGTNEFVRSHVFRTAGAVPHPSRRAPGRAPQGEEVGERAKLAPMGVPPALIPSPHLGVGKVPKGGWGADVVCETNTRVRVSSTTSAPLRPFGAPPQLRWGGKMWARRSRSRGLRSAA